MVLRPVARSRARYRTRMPRRPPQLRVLLLAAAPLLAPAPLAVAQSETFALDEHREWTRQEAPVPGSDEWLVAEARRLIVDGQPAEARRRLSKFLSATGGTSQLRPEALLARADALVAMGDEYQALYDYERVIREHVASPAFARAVERELEIAIRYANGLKRKVWGLRLFDAGDAAVEIFIRAQERLPGSRVAERAAIELADYYYRERNIDLAAQAYRLYLENFPNGPNARRAAKRRIYADIARFKGPEHDASPLIDAQIRISRFEAMYPAEAERSGINQGLASRLDESLAAQLLSNAEWYIKRGELASARTMLRRLAARYPQSLAGRRALDMLERRGWRETPVVGPPAPPAAATAPEDVEIEGPTRARPVGGAETPADEDAPEDGDAATESRP